MSVLKIKKQDGTWEIVGGSSNLEVDASLKLSGKAADAKAVSDALNTRQPLGDYATRTDLNFKANQDVLNEHTSNFDVHVSTEDRNAWNSKLGMESELITIAEIDEICGSVTPIAEVLF